METKETILFGVKTGDEDWQEVLLSTKPEMFNAVRRLATNDGFGRFREATIDLSIKPDFRKTVRKL